MTNVIAICPGEHREAHFGERRDEMEAEMIAKVAAAELSRLPVSLSDGQRAYLLLPYADIAETLIANSQTGKVKLTPVCVDSADNV